MQWPRKSNERLSVGGDRCLKADYRHFFGELGQRFKSWSSKFVNRPSFLLEGLFSYGLQNPNPQFIHHETKYQGINDGPVW